MDNFSLNDVPQRLTRFQIVDNSLKIVDNSVSRCPTTHVLLNLYNFLAYISY